MHVERKDHDVWVTIGDLNIPMRISPYLARTISKGLKDVLRDGGNKRWVWGQSRLAITVSKGEATILLHDSVSAKVTYDELRELSATLNSHALGTSD